MSQEDNRAFLQFKEIIQLIQADNGGVKEPELTEPRLFLENMQAMVDNRIIQKDKLRDNVKGGWHIKDLVNPGGS